MEAWLRMTEKTCLCCDLVGILHLSLNEIVTWRVHNDFALWCSLKITWKVA